MADSVDIKPRFAATETHTTYHTQTQPQVQVQAIDPNARGFFSNEYLLIGIIIVLVTVVVLLIVYVVRIKNASTRDEQHKCEEIQCNPEMNDEMFNVASRPFVPRSAQPPIQRVLRQPGGNVHIEAVEETSNRTNPNAANDPHTDIHIDPIDFNRINAADETVRGKNEYSTPAQVQPEETKTASDETEQHIEEEQSAEKQAATSEQLIEEPATTFVRQRGRPRGTHN
jgi:type IV secretory pathway VirB10-like protein